MAVVVDPELNGDPAASSVAYDNGSSGLTATNVQDAIDELSDSAGFDPEAAGAGIIFADGVNGKLQTAADSTNTGNLDIATGDSSASYTGYVYLKTGTGANETSSGFVQIETGPSTGFAGSSGSITVRTGSTDMEASGAVTVDTGFGPASGNMLVRSGDATTTVSGDVDIKSGDAPNTGDIRIRSGTGDTVTGGVTVGSGNGLSTGGARLISGNGSESGPTYVFSGNASSSDSGEIAIRTGTAAAAVSGDLTLSTGSGDIGSGEVNIASGTVLSSGPSGDINIASGPAIADETGSIYLTTGTSDLGGSSRGGIGLDAPSIFIQGRVVYNAVGEYTTTATLSEYEMISRLDPADGAQTFTMPPVVSNGQPLVIINASAFAVTLAPNSGQSMTTTAMAAASSHTYMYSTTSNSWHLVSAAVEVP